jgi:hypothetical protein
VAYRGILDKQGRIRYTHIGEGAYEMQEKLSKRFLPKAKSKLPI